MPNDFGAELNGDDQSLFIDLTGAVQSSRLWVILRGSVIMAQQPVLLQLPEPLYERVRELAQGTNRSVESLLLDSLTLLFSEQTDELSLDAGQLESASDEALWALVFRPFGWRQDERLRELTGQGQNRLLSADEQGELERLIDQVDQYTLLRSTALVLLKGRGYDVESRLKQSA